MALVWPRGRSNLDFVPFSTVFRSPRFYPLENVPESRICSNRSENTRFRVSHSQPDYGRIRDPPIFTPVRYLYRIADLVSSSAGRTLISVSARQPGHSSVFAQRIEVTADEFAFFLSILFILPYCLGKRIDFCSVEFLVFFPCRIYRSGCHSSGAALPRPTGQFQIL
jgi:hypothetical protein